MTTDTKQSYFKEAKYIDPGLPEYADNPLIAALPSIQSVNEVAALLSKRPKFDNKEIGLKGHIRVHAISRLTRDLFAEAILAEIQKLPRLSAN